MGFDYQATFSLIEWLALTGLAQSLLILVYIIFRVRNWRQASVALAYFTFLAFAFGLQFALRLDDYENYIRLGLGFAVLPVFLAAIYGGFFGVALSVMFLAMVGLAIDDTLTRLNALKQAMSLSCNVAAALYFAIGATVVWSACGAMAVGALFGGWLGGRFASAIRPQTLRLIVIVIGLIIAAMFGLGWKP